MIFQIALILVSIGFLSICWAVVEVMVEHLSTINNKKTDRTEIVQKRFDK